MNEMIHKMKIQMLPGNTLLFEAPISDVSGPQPIKLGYRNDPLQQYAFTSPENPGIILAGCPFRLLGSLCKNLARPHDENNKIILFPPILRTLSFRSPSNISPPACNSFPPRQISPENASQIPPDVSMKDRD
jgi:hypothetical protein